MTRTPAIAMDRDRCLGVGMCSFHAPSTFDISEDDMRVVLLEGRDDAVAIRNAAESCPNRVITLDFSRPEA